MEKAIVMGCACVVISSLTPEEIDRFIKYDPESMVLKKDEGAVFSIQLDDGPGSLVEDCATYGKTKSADGKATITILLDPEAEDKVGMVQEKLGPALLKLDELESQIIGKKDQLLEKEKAVGERIAWM